MAVLGRAYEVAHPAAAAAAACSCSAINPSSITGVLIERQSRARTNKARPTEGERMVRQNRVEREVKRDVGGREEAGSKRPVLKIKKFT